MHHGESVLYCPNCHPGADALSTNENVTTVEQSSAANAMETTLVSALSAVETALTPSRVKNKGGRPTGSTDANIRAAKLAQRKAINWVVLKYALAQLN